MEPTIISLESCSQLWYGAPKIGKSTLASLIPSAYFLRCEDRHKFIKTDGTDIRSWLDFANIVVELLEKENKTNPLIIDPINDLYAMCDAQFCKDNGVDDVSDIPQGKGWKGMRNKFRRPIKELLNAGYSIIFIAHEDVVTFRTGKTEKQKFWPDMDKTMIKAILPSVDMIGRLYVDKHELKGKMADCRFITFQNADDIKVGDGSDFLSCHGPILLEPKEEGWNILKAKFEEAQKQKLEKEQMELTNEERCELEALQASMDEATKKIDEGEFKEGDQLCYIADCHLFKGKQDGIWRIVFKIRGGQTENKYCEEDNIYKLEKGSDSFEYLKRFLNSMGYRGDIKMTEIEGIGLTLKDKIFRAKITYAQNTKDDGTHYKYFNNIRAGGSVVDSEVSTDKAPF